MPNIDKTNNDDIRTEYAALTAYGRQIVTFRFTLLGFFLAAVGMIVSGVNPSIWKYILLCFLTFALYLLELRNRSLLIDLDERGMQIEHDYWKYVGEKENDPFISRQHRPGPRYTKVWGKKVKLPVSHGKAFDLIYFIVVIYSLLNIVFCLTK